MVGWMGVSSISMSMSIDIVGTGYIGYIYCDHQQSRTEYDQFIFSSFFSLFLSLSLSFSSLYVCANNKKKKKKERRPTELALTMTIPSPSPTCIHR